MRLRANNGLVDNIEQGLTLCSGEVVSAYQSDKDGVDSRRSYKQLTFQRENIYGV